MEDSDAEREEYSNDVGDGSCGDEKATLLTKSITFNKREYTFRLISVVIGFLDETKGLGGPRRAWRERFLNWLVRLKTKGITHSELIFVVEMLGTGERYWIACNVRWVHRLQFEFRDFSSFAWTFGTLILRPAQLSQLWEECTDDIEQRLDYNRWVFWNFAVPSFLAVDYGGRRKAFCSEHQVHKLRNIGWREFDNVKAYNTDPRQLLDLLIEGGDPETGMPRYTVAVITPSAAKKGLVLDLSPVLGAFARRDANSFSTGRSY